MNGSLPDFLKTGLDGCFIKRAAFALPMQSPSSDLLPRYLADIAENSQEIGAEAPDVKK